jgi:hypothetical protein
LPKVTELPKVEEKQQTLDMKEKQVQKPWYAEDEAILRKMYPFESKEAILEALSNAHDWKSIQQKAFRMKLKRVNREKFVRKCRKSIFTEKEDSIIRELFSTTTTYDIQKLLPGKTVNQIYNRATIKLGLKKLDSTARKEKEYRKEKYSKDSEYMKKVNSVEEEKPKKCIYCMTKDAEPDEDLCADCATALDKQTDKAIFR